MKPRLEFIVPGDPRPCGRPRAVPIMRNGRPVLTKDGRPLLNAYMPPETKEYEERVARFAEVAVGNTPDWRVVREARLPLRVHLHFVRRARRGDHDNFQKGAIDGMGQAGVVFENDSVIVQALVSVHTDPDAEPRTEILVETANAVLDEPLWMRCAREAGWNPPSAARACPTAPCPLEEQP
jgi:Holliday junction resolvase RusA-like endonuclease